MIGIIFDIARIKDSLVYNTLTKEKVKGANVFFVAIDDDLFEELEISKDRKAFINSKKFIDGVVYSYCTTYDSKNNAISIDGCDASYIELLLDTISRFFEEDVLIVASYNDGLIDRGFANPMICSETGEVCLVKKNSLFKENDSKSVKVEYDFLVSQKDKEYCEINIRFDKETEDFLKKIANAGVTVKDNVRSQKEFFGHFKILKTEKRGNSITSILKVDKTSIIAGDTENISAQASIYNFHSHPFEAYLKYRVNYAPPSSQDYKSIFILATQHNTIAHFVASVEGLYVVSVNPEKYGINPNDIIRRQDYDDVDTFEELEKYIEKVNSYEIFNLRLLEWDSDEFQSGIKIKFGKSGNYENCKIRED